MLMGEYRRLAMNVALIPVRGGSKSIPLKNIKMLCGKPLVYWVLKAANGCEKIDKIYVATDSFLIKETVESFGFNNVLVIDRSEAVSTDLASTESVMLEFANTHSFDNIILIQATSPLLTSEDINKGFEAFEKENVDSVLSVVKQKRFCWDNDVGCLIKPINYNPFNRPRRQDFNGYYVENGAFYICRKKDLLETGNRISGNISFVEMPDDTYYEIDEPSDWPIIESLMEKRGLKNMFIPKIKMFLTDCDGCLTDGGMYYSEKGDELKKFNTKDGMAFRLLKERGIITGIITSENMELNNRRAEKLKLDIIEQNCKDKLLLVNSLCGKYGINMENVAYVGDDINDIEVLKAVGFSICPRNATTEVITTVNYHSPICGGDGVIRDATNIILEAQNELP